MGFRNGLCVALLSGESEAGYRLVDPQRVEFAPYKPFIKAVYVHDHEVIEALDWLEGEMDARFDNLERHGVRDIAAYNDARPMDDRLPRIVLVVDELASLMLGPSKARIELPLTRLAQMSRAVGIHLVLATQRPPVDVVTGLLKANIPGRVSFSVITQIDSRVILDEPGAEELVGKGDMLARIPGTRGLHRLPGASPSTEDGERVVNEHTEAAP